MKALRPLTFLVMLLGVSCVQDQVAQPESVPLIQRGVYGFRRGGGRLHIPSDSYEIYYDFFGQTSDDIKFYHVKNKEALYASRLRGGTSSFLRGYVSLIGKSYDEVARHYVSKHRGYTALFMRNRILIETMTRGRGPRGAWGGLLCVFDGDRLSVVKELRRGVTVDLIIYDSSLAVP